MTKPYPFSINSHKFDTSKFIQLSKEKFNQKFDYSLIQNANFSLLKIICPVHGEIVLSAEEHFDVGCELCEQEQLLNEKEQSKCVKFTINEEYNRTGSVTTNLPLNNFKEIWTLYFIKLTHQITTETFYKIGITKNSLKVRYSRGYRNWIIEPINTFDYNKEHIILLEKIILHENKNIQYFPVAQFAGYTECFSRPIDIKSYMTY